MKVQWLTKSPAMQSYFNSESGVHFTGGTLYEIDAINAIRKKYELTLNQAYIKRENFISYYLKTHNNTINADVCITDPYVLAFNKLNYKKKNVAIIHHIDETLFQKSVLGKFFLKQLIRNLKKVDWVVVVSRFWKEYLERKGIKNIKIIYNSYRTDHFKFDDFEFSQLEEKLNLDQSKPTLYLGKYGTGKGVELILDHIDTTKYNLITSGKKGHPSNKVQSIYLSKKEFPMLLKIADVTLAMSTMMEGWNRIAHEALMVKTPVIGSGSGGMGELLTRSNQTIVKDYAQLDEAITKVLANKTVLGQQGFDFVKQFDMNYFETSWLNLINQFEEQL